LSTIVNIVPFNTKKSPLKRGYKDRDGVYGKEKLQLLLLHYLLRNSTIQLRNSTTGFKKLNYTHY
jgi:hypothetical protein